MLVTVLSRTLGRTIVDRTGLTGKYDFTLEYAPEEGGAQQPGAGAEAGGALPSSPSDSAPSIFTALQEQLGLKLESTEGPGGRHCHRPHRKGRRELALVTPRKTAISVTSRPAGPRHEFAFSGRLDLNRVTDNKTFQALRKSLPDRPPFAHGGKRRSIKGIEFWC